jgi:hypothetical protein
MARDSDTLGVSGEREIAEGYRQRAVEIRAIAQDAQGETRQILQQVADDYDHMAATMDNIAATNEAISRRN